MALKGEAKAAYMRNYMRAYRARQPRRKISPPTAHPLPDVAAANVELIRRLKAYPRAVALWLRGELGEAAANDFWRALAPVTDPEVARLRQEIARLTVRLNLPPAQRPTLSRDGETLNLYHLRLAPDQMIPWVVDRLAADAPPDLHDALGAVLRDLAQVLQVIRPNAPRR
jgi:hypothetical protein